MAKKTDLKKENKYEPKAVENAALIAEAVNGDSAIITTNIIKDGNQYTVTKDFDYSPENVIETDTKEPEKIEQKTETPAPLESAPVETPDDAGIDAAFEAQAEMYDKGEIPAGDGLF